MDMKEIISAIVLIATLFAGTHLLKDVHDSVRKAALVKAAKGLPSLTRMAQSFQKQKEKEVYKSLGK